MNRILKLEPFINTKVWGYEKWNLSTHKNGQCSVKGRKGTLLDVIKKDIPIIIKVINAKERLSVQVHPDDKFAQKYENDRGKIECWYILDAKQDARVICGLKEKVDCESLKDIINSGKIEQYLYHINIKRGDMIYIPAGTVHAIEGGIKLVEVQQSSDITYRIYDWGRNRRTDVEKALQIINYEDFEKTGKIENFKMLNTPKFNVEKICIDGAYYDESIDGFNSYTVINGNGVICSGFQREFLNPEESVYIKENVKYKIMGKVQLLKVWGFL